MPILLNAVVFVFNDCLQMFKYISKIAWIDFAETESTLSTVSPEWAFAVTWRKKLRNDRPHIFLWIDPAIPPLLLFKFFIVKWCLVWLKKVPHLILQMLHQFCNFYGCCRGKLWNLAGIDDYANQVEDYVNLFKVVLFSFSEHFLEIWNRQPLFYLFDIVMQQKVFM